MPLFMLGFTWPNILQSAWFDFKRKRSLFKRLKGDLLPSLIDLFDLGFVHF